MSWYSWVIIAGIIAIAIFIINVFRSRSDGIGVSDNNDSPQKFRRRIESLRDTNIEIGNGLEKLGDNNQSAQTTTADIKRHNQSAKSGIRTAIEIMEDAKNRSDTPES
jgi:hypothetical protein